MSAVTWGAILVVSGLASAVSALFFFVSWWRMRDHGRGTPLYARGRSARRSTIYALIFAVLLLVLGRFTPLWEATLA
jgi:hypothetical protein